MNIFICVCFSYETVHSIIPSPIHGHLSAIFMSENTWPKAADHARATFFFFFFLQKKEEREKKGNKTQVWSFILPFETTKSLKGTGPNRCFIFSSLVSRKDFAFNPDDSNLTFPT